MSDKNYVSLHHQHDAQRSAGEWLSEIILGGQDGLVNTLGVILGLAAASSDFRIVVAGGLAGAIAEAVSMGAVGYTSKAAERDYYLSERAREEYEIDNMPHEEEQEVRDIYEKKGFKGDLLESVVKVLTLNRDVWLDTMMQQELKLMPVKYSQPMRSALLIGVAAMVGALVPLLPFLVFYLAQKAGVEIGVIGLSIALSLILSALTLFVVGVVKAKLTIGKWYKSGLQMMVIGVFSALIGYLIGAMFSL